MFAVVPIAAVPIAAVAALVLHISKKPKKPTPAVGPMCNTGNCNPKAAATPDPSMHPIILDPPRSVAHLNDSVPISAVETLGSTTQIQKIRTSVTMQKENAAMAHEGIAIGQAAMK